MRTVKAFVVFGALLAAVAGSSAAAAHGYSRGHGHYGGHSRFSVGVYLGPAAVYRPWYYAPAYPYYAYPPAVIAVPSSPPVYIERDDGARSAPAPQAQASWYFCPESNAYYPYVKECPGGWQAVAPAPAR